MPRKNILVVELDPQISVALELFLQGRGYLAHMAATPAAAIQHAAIETVEVVLIGNLPDSTDAASVAQRLRGVLGNWKGPVIVMAHAMDEVIGADLVIPMGAHPRAILDAIRTVGRRQAPTPPATLDEVG